MKKLTVLIIGLFLIINMSSQTYVPFPTDNSQWNSLTKIAFPPLFYYLNSQYIIQGDTILDNVNYKKVYFTEDIEGAEKYYIGGIREDTNKNIYFYPQYKWLPNWCSSEFPSDTTEYLLYTFDNLTPGMILPINTDVTEIEVVEVDSILLQNTYRKRYKIEQGNIGGPQYWIEGIGSDKDLFAPYSTEFEWVLYTLCFTDSLTYYINSPNGEDSCHYWLPVSTKELTSSNLSIFPNPASQSITIDFRNDIKNSSMNIYNNKGQKIHSCEIAQRKTTINISQFETGIYFLEINGEKRTVLKFIKE